ncbi:tRNA-guanine(15) transglycosylase-like protein [Tricharina praecox]|uniref:tRNA-guanine(15) transglycosylase-like protein n=1 Tax=Tricharina praecox TaxID=43433 RepID=UPI0022205F70|nr:tRNA-guanine(15) transglycosylase-like protein [Tricharina praecox]KAI5854187.1 tRNA-guanine(15) transglycosylase-like protein [Tricharina praecox]
MFSFRLLPSTATATATAHGARLGRLVARNVQIDTPAFLAPTSRGVVPHLSHDNLRDHTDIRGVYAALEDFIEKGIPGSPAFQFPGPLRAFTGQPSSSLLFLAARRCPPVPAPATNTDHSISMLTSVGFRELEVNDYISCLSHLQPDAVIGLADIPAKKAGKNRMPKMVDRTELWLETLLRITEGSRTPIFAPILPIEIEQQRLYIQSIAEEMSTRLAGLAFYNSTLVPDMPSELEGLPRFAMDDPATPHILLQAIARGVDLFSLVFPTEATDAGFSLEFEFPGKVEGGEEGKRKPLARDMWAGSEEMKTDTKPLVEGCNCYACRRHHRAYVCHLLAAKEMTAWVLLQLHNIHVTELFFDAVRKSIADGTFEEDCRMFAMAYENEMPKQTGGGPRHVLHVPMHGCDDQRNANGKID